MFGSVGGGGGGDGAGKTRSQTKSEKLILEQELRLNDQAETIHDLKQENSLVCSLLLRATRAGFTMSDRLSTDRDEFTLSLNFPRETRCNCYE